MRETLRHYYISFWRTSPSILNLILLTWRIWRVLNNASKWQIGFNSAFKGLRMGYAQTVFSLYAFVMRTGTTSKFERTHRPYAYIRYTILSLSRVYQFYGAVVFSLRFSLHHAVCSQHRLHNLSFPAACRGDQPSQEGNGDCSTELLSVGCHPLYQCNTRQWVAYHSGTDVSIQLRH